MLGNLSSRLQDIFNKIRDKGKLSEKDIQQSLREVKLALLEADVHYKVVKDFIAKIEEQANQQDISKSLTPGQQMIKITHEVLTEILGQKQSKLEIGNANPTNILLVGLQGSGKTTTASKLALQTKGKGYVPLLVAGDKIRPAATEQLQLMGKKAGVDVFSKEGNISLIEIIFEA
ncbi:MAG: signal recognition particle receptor subunit alpha, partial [Candidatus Atribacteria bacterium]|nr:signal recognition particle receptor subunit alpha [Candidatus Atribacteria bacterium]